MDVRLPSGKVIRGIPDGTTRSEIRQRLLASGMSNEDIDGPTTAPNPAEGMSGLDKFGATVGAKTVELGQGVRQLVNAGDQDALRQEVADSQALHAPVKQTGVGMATDIGFDIASLAVPGGAALRGAKGAQMLAAALRGKSGQVAADVGRGLRATGRTLVAPTTFKGAATQGAILGGLKPTQNEGETLSNMGMGAAGGVAGQGIAKTLGTIAQPVKGAITSTTRGLVDALQERGISLSTAQIKDSRPLKFMESAFASLPFTAGREAERTITQNRQFTAAALKAAGSDAQEATPEVLNETRRRLGQTFQTISNLPKIKLGDDFLERLTKLDSAQAEVRGMVDTSKIDNLVTGALDKLAKGELSGNAAQTIRSELGKEARAAAGTQNNRLESALKEVRDGIDNAIRDQLSPAQKQAWDLAREQYTALKTVERAMNKTTETASRGMVSPQALGEAVRAQDKSRFPRATGELETLARAGTGVLKPTPTSGTAERDMMIRLMTGGGLTGGGLAASGATGDPTYAMLGAASLGAPRAIQSAYYNKTVQKYLTSGAGKVTKDAIVGALRAPLPKAVDRRITSIVNSRMPDAAKRRIIGAALRGTGRSAAVGIPAAAASDSDVSK